MIQYTSYKKSIIFIIGFLFFTTFVKAQDLSRPKQLLQQKDFARAQEAIDSFVQLNDAHAEGWLLKATIYNAISKDAAAKELVADARQEAFMALQKAMQINSAGTTEQVKKEQYNLPFDLYKGYTNQGVAYFNAGAERNDKTSYAEALNNFKKAGLVGNYINTNGWGLSAIDTNNLYYCAKAAINAGKEEDAALFAKKIADAGIVKNLASKGFEPIYQWLAYNYKQKQDGENLLKYATLGTKQFPASVYFNLIYIDWLRQQKDYSNMFALYQDVFKKLPNNNGKYQLAYYNDVFNYLYQSGEPVSDQIKYEKVLSTGLLQYIKANPASAEGRLLLGKLYINQANDVSKEWALRSTTDPKILNGYKTARRNLLLKSNKYLLEIVNKFAKPGAAVYIDALQLVVGNFRALNMPKEMSRYKAKMK
jgi:hypothetical protein